MPRNHAAWAAIQNLVQQGALREALGRLAVLLPLDPDDVEANKLGADINFRLGQREEAFRFATRAFELDPTDIAYGLDCAFNLIRAGRRYDALRIAERLSEQSIQGPYYCDALGTILTHCESPDRALPYFERACAEVDDSPGLLFNLASAQRMSGAVADAEASLDRALQLDPRDGQAHLARAQLRRQTPARNHVDELKSALFRANRREAQVPIGYALAKELEDLGQYAQSFQYLAAASRLHRSGMVYDPAKEIALLRTLGEQEYSRRAKDRAPQAGESARPIFVMGLPRSGTTLVDRIIASVPDVTSAGETNVLAAELWRAAAPNGQPTDPVTAVAQAIREHASKIGDNYLVSFKGRFGGRFIDKTPNNVQFAGLISAALPGARMVCLRRHPMDSCFAMYKMLFAGPYGFSYDLRELADYFVAWDRLVRRWETALGESWLTVSYEELVADPERTMRRIIAHCGLTWTDACLRFHELGTPVTSASAGQVSRPIHGNSIGLWRNYENELSDLAERLRNAGLL
jgi:tetratricopeptide (TPR) repeat protein